MSSTLRTTRLQLTLRSLEATKAWVNSLPPEVQREISPVWLARLNNATEPTPWICGFDLVRVSDRISVGSCAFKSPPENGVVEIAYGIDDEHQRQGYATEAAIALAQFALQTDGVKTVCAHTKEDNFASIRVLEKAGFQGKGTVIDPEDGEVLRFEKSL
ncbi:MAG: GNAT family N-acetyltransferase [Planctomycetes bacterium]|nr:GNAT family N-acetyltransferase [Planctomycetota bacterium]